MHRVFCSATRTACESRLILGCDNQMMLSQLFSPAGTHSSGLQFVVLSLFLLLLLRTLSGLEARG